MYKIAVIPGDGIGREVIDSGVEVLKALSNSVQNLPFDFHQFNWGAEYYKKHGVMMPEEGVEELKSFNAYLNLNTDNIPKISSAMAYYQRNNDDDPFDYENPTENTIMGYRVGYELSKGVSLIWDFRQFYRDDGTGKMEPIQQTNIETTFNF